jgi:HSP20 family molecular chaperone IbpA
MNTVEQMNHSPRAEEGAAREDTLAPRVDVHEDAEGITLYADLPGVASDGLEVQVDKDTLRIRGEGRIEMPDGIEPLFAELRSRNWSRAFALSSELDADAIQARLRDGVLEVRVPKRAEIRPRRIEVRVS